MLELVSRSVAETEGVAAALADRLRPGDVVVVRGEIGTGKTTFIRAACRALGVTDRVTSPTFTIGHRYDGRSGPISHLDLYRFDGLSDAEWGDLEPYFDGATAFVEWPDAAAGWLPPPAVEVTLEHRGSEERGIRIESRSEVLLQGVGPC